MNLKEKDWVFYDFHLAQITKVRKEDWGTSYTLSDGMFDTGTTSPKCFPLSLENNVACIHVDHYKREIQKVAPNGFNWPDCQRKLVSLWVNICSKPKEERKEAYELLAKECNEIIEACESARDNNVAGFSFFRN